MMSQSSCDVPDCITTMILRFWKCSVVVMDVALVSCDIVWCPSHASMILPVGMLRMLWWRSGHVVMDFTILPY